MDPFFDFYLAHRECFLILFLLASIVFLYWHFRGFFRYWLGLLRHFREQRLSENLSPGELLQKELKLLGAALLVIVGLFAFLLLLAWAVLRGR